MTCSCGLSREEVLEISEKHGVRLVGGKCQNPFLANSCEGICGMPVGAHPSQRGKYIVIFII